MIQTWLQLRECALGLTVPEVTVDYPHGHESLKSFGKLWCHWSPHADSGVFKAGREEREMLMQADPDTFFLHPHYAIYDYVLVGAGRIDPVWATGRLITCWPDNAPKCFLKYWEARNA